jgi:formate dehydrogenase subunit delta
MADTTKTLVRMAGQIADFFRPYGEEKAVAGVAKHIRDFWTPQMRRDMEHHIEGHRDAIEPIVARAFEQLAGERSGAAEAPQAPEGEANARQSQLASSAN